MKSRFLDLDALRGYAVFTMVLSGSIAFGGALPGWMYHAQVPPPLHQFNPQWPGITWVDLVFPFFLFALGAAIPLALQKAQRDNRHQQVWVTAFRRYGLLLFFAYFFEHAKAARIAEQPTAGTWLFSLACFGLLFLAFVRWPNDKTKPWFPYVQWGAVGLGLVLFLVYPFNKGAGFQLKTADIIIVVLANMALFGTLIWWFTRHQPVLRLGVLLLVAAVFIAGKTEGSWQEWLYQLTPNEHFYRFYFLKYLFIVLPGTWAGEALLKEGDIVFSNEKQRAAFKLLGFLLFLVLVVNLWGLYTRALWINGVLTLLLLVFSYYWIKENELFQIPLLPKFFWAGSFLLLLGLAFEASEGGIKKDPSTYSYYFVTSGLAIFVLTMMGALALTQWGKGLHRFWVRIGQNPMMAYVMGGLVLTPLLHLTGLYGIWSGMNQGFVMGLLKGLLFTVVACALTLPFTRKGITWKS